MLLDFLRRLKRLENLVAAGGGGGGGIETPLSRYKFIDGGALESTRNGSPSAAAFKSVPEWLASLGTTTTAADSQAQQCALLTPCLAGYTGDVTFPAYRSLSLTADSLGLASLPGGVAIAGNAVWHNVAGTNHAPSSAAVLEIGAPFTGNLTCTDDVVSSVIVLSSEGSLPAGTNTGFVNIDCSAMSHLVSFGMFGRGCSGFCDLGATVPLTANNGGVLGLTTCKSIVANQSSFGSMTLAAASTSSFIGCGFAPNPVLTGTQTTIVYMDGVTIRQFAASGGTRFPVASDVGPVIVVAGGYNGGEVQGANLPTGAGPTAVSLNGTGAAAGYQGSNSGNHYTSTGLTADSVVQVVNGGVEKGGDTLLITKSDLVAHTLTVKNNANTIVGVIPSAGRGFILVRYSVAAGDWVLAGCGSLAA